MLDIDLENLKRHAQDVDSQSAHKCLAIEAKHLVKLVDRLQAAEEYAKKQEESAERYMLQALNNGAAANAAESKLAEFAEQTKSFEDWIKSPQGMLAASKDILHFESYAEVQIERLKAAFNAGVNSVPAEQVPDNAELHCMEAGHRNYFARTGIKCSCKKYLFNPSPTPPSEPAQAVAIPEDINKQFILDCLRSYTKHLVSLDGYEGFIYKISEQMDLLSAAPVNGEVKL